jgi:hypothetical protein
MEQTVAQMRRLAEGSFSAQPLYLATALNQKTIALTSQKRYAEAEPVARRALEIQEKARGPDHPDVALVAGARRVVASDWLVDDEAAASLVSYFCGGIAQGTEGGHTPDYAEALSAAKRWVRGQEKWQSPYYWAPFVLVGPQ